MYYIKYNNIDLSTLVKVREISLPSLPSIDHSSINMWEMDGNVFNSLSYGNREIELLLLIQPDDPNDLEICTQDVKRAFFTREPQQLFLGDDSKYIYAVPEGDVVIAELGLGTNEIEVTLLCYDPFWYDVEIQTAFSTENEFSITNRGDVSSVPVIDIEVGADTHFIQLENKTTKERILIGEKPTVSKPEAIKANDTVLLDDCELVESTLEGKPGSGGWTSVSRTVDTGCGTGGTLINTGDGFGICIGNFGSGSTTWKGACYEKGIGINIKDFKVKVDMTFNSCGMNGDPTKKQYMDDCVGTLSGGSRVETDEVISGTTSYEYYASNPNSDLTVIRDKNGAQIGLFSNGESFIDGVVQSDGRLKIWLPWFNNSEGYVDRGCYKSRTKTNTVVTLVNRSVTPTWTDTVANYIANTTAKLRSAASEDANIKCTIPAGTILRCSTTLKDEIVKETDENGGSSGTKNKYWYVYSGYKNNTGYVKESELTKASDMQVVYDREVITADDKTGRVQLCGYDSSGNQLFSLGLIDDNEWYEATYPVIKKNGKEFLKDSSFMVPDPKEEIESVTNNTIKYEQKLSGSYGNWNEFDGQLYIERVDDVWYAWVKNGSKKISTAKVKDTTNSSASLSRLVMYFGTSNTNENKYCDMSINRIQVQTANEIKPAEQNVQYFEKGDVVSIDCGIPCVRVNGEERNDLVDIGSQFFDLEKGENHIKIASDSSLSTSVAYNKKYL